MKPIKVSEATGPVLDWMVAKCEAQELTQAANWVEITKHYGHLQKKKGGHYAPSTDWAQGGPIIEWELITLCVVVNGHEWAAKGAHNYSYGVAPLIAAMRCFVASKLGDTVEVPEELCK